MSARVTPRSDSGAIPLRYLARWPKGRSGRLPCRTPCRSRALVDAEVEGLMKSLITAIVQSLVDRPDEVQIKEVIGEHAHVLELRVAKEDLGKVIGKGGAHASAIRTLMAAASGKEKKRYILEIIEY
jgi:predicted RNA-binding protein YlqC (UPF0109 family)